MSHFRILKILLLSIFLSIEFLSPKIGMARFARHNVVVRLFERFSTVCFSSVTNDIGGGNQLFPWKITPYYAHLNTRAFTSLWTKNERKCIFHRLTQVSNGGSLQNFRMIWSHYSKNLIFVQKVNFDKTFLLNQFDFLRPNWQSIWKLLILKGLKYLNF